MQNHNKSCLKAGRGRRTRTYAYVHTAYTRRSAVAKPIFCITIISWQSSSPAQLGHYRLLSSLARMREPAYVAGAHDSDADKFSVPAMRAHGGRES